MDIYVYIHYTYLPPHTHIYTRRRYVNIFLLLCLVVCIYFLEMYVSMSGFESESVRDRNTGVNRKDTHAYMRGEENI